MEQLYGTGVAADELKGLDREAIVQEFLDDALDAYAEREREIEGMQEGLMRDLERYIVLQVVDVRWREHLENMDYMREGIHLRGMAQKDPLVEYRNEGAAAVHRAEPRDPRGGHRTSLPRRDRAARRPRARTAAGRHGQRERQLRAPVARRRRRDRGRRWSTATATAALAGGGSVATATAPRPVVKGDHENIGRNDPCWCGSGKKFKRCHGA